MLVRIGIAPPSDEAGSEPAALGDEEAKMLVRMGIAPPPVCVAEEGLTIEELLADVG